KPASPFSRSPIRSGPACVALEPAKKNEPRTLPPVARVSSAAARRFSTRRSDTRSVYRTVGRGILYSEGYSRAGGRHGIPADGEDLVQREARAVARRKSARACTRSSLRDRRVRGDAVVPDRGGPRGVSPRQPPRSVLPVGGGVRHRHPLFGAAAHRRDA